MGKTRRQWARLLGFGAALSLVAGLMAPAVASAGSVQIESHRSGPRSWNSGDHPGYSRRGPPHGDWGHHGRHVGRHHHPPWGHHHWGPTPWGPHGHHWGHRDHHDPSGVWWGYAPAPVWVPGQWVWTGWDWYWQPGYWQ
ncbi:MAG: hypothetical protein ACRELA_24755 [Candidatus Rokuibacteriota bacterium]